MKKNSLSNVKYHDFVFAQKEPFLLENQETLSKVNIRYECYGKLNAEKSNAILIIHALTGNHHAAGYYKDEKVPGWWDNFIGPGKALDTNKFFVLSSNNLGGCSGSTGPNSINPLDKNGEPYGLNFPSITLGDMVKMQFVLMQHLSIPCFHTIIGSSMGGMMALHWSVHYAKYVKNVIAIAATDAQNSQSIAFSEVARQAITRDPHFKEGKYYQKNKNKENGPKNGLAIARMLAHITYLSDLSMRRKFGRKLNKKNQKGFVLDVEFEIESYLRYQGAKFTDRFDANSYLYITKAMNYFNLKDGFKNLEETFKMSSSRYLIISFNSDWLYPTYMSKQLVEAMLNAGREASFAEIKSDAGHDAFLLEKKELTILIQSFLHGVTEKWK